MDGCEKSASVGSTARSSWQRPGSALEDANITSRDVEMVYGGTMAPGRFMGQEHMAALMADQLGFKNMPAVRIENACASGGSALRQGYIAVASGIHDIVVVGGVEKMTDVTTSEATTALGGAGDQEWELFQGITFPGSTRSWRGGTCTITTPRRSRWRASR